MALKHASSFVLFLLSFAVSQAQMTAPQKPAATSPVTPLVEETTLPEPPVMKESWTKLVLKDSGLSPHAFGATTLSKNDLPEGCTRELLHMEWRPSDPIDVYVIRPDDTPKPAVGLFLLNYTFDTSVFRNDYWCSQAKEQHLAIVAFGSALSVQRFHAPRPMKQWFVSELQESLATSTHDVQMILNYLDTRDDMDHTHVGMYGQGSGGAVAILAAAVDPRISALQVVNPWGDWPDWLRGSAQIPEEERKTYLTSEFLGTVATLDPVTYLPQLKLRSLRVQQVLADTVTPPEAKDKIAQATPVHEDLVRFSDDAAQHKAVFLDGVAGWLAQQLQADRAVAQR